MKIEIKDNPDNKNLKSAEFPFDKNYIGDEGTSEKFKIFIRQETLKSIDDYLSSDLNNELGGVLVGDVCVNSDAEQFISIDNLIIAEHTNSSISRLTFTHETWDKISTKLENDFPGKIILGWFHSHPGHTVFLSNYDLFIQENFFNLDYMTAYVFDPVINERGFFYKKENKIVKADGFYLYDIINNDGLKDLNVKKTQTSLKEKSSDNTIPKITEKPIENKKGFSFDLKNMFLITFTILNFLLMMFLIYNNYALNQRVSLNESLTKELIDVKADNTKLKERLDNIAIELALNNNISEPVRKDEQKEEPEENKKHDEKINKPAETKISTQNKSTDNSTAGESIKYTVKAGDSLEKISFQFYKSRAGIDILLKKNNLKKPTDIKLGQILEIPESVE